MDKETFVIKGRERFHVPITHSRDDYTHYVILLRDVVSIISITTALSTVLICLPLILYELTVYISEGIPAVANQEVLFEFVAVLVGFLLGVVSAVLQLNMRHRPKHRNELILLLAVCVLSVLTTATGMMGAISTRLPIHLQVSLLPTKIHVVLLPSAYKTDLNDVLVKKIKVYNSDANVKTTMDNLQTWLKCCGANRNHHDWLRLTGSIPGSCCMPGKCTESNAYQDNCLDKVAMQVAKFSSLLIGFGFIFVVIMLFTIALYSYFLWTLNRDAKGVGVSVLREKTSKFERSDSETSILSYHEDDVSNSSSLEEIVLKDLYGTKAVDKLESENASEDENGNLKGQSKLANNYVG